VSGLPAALETRNGEHVLRRATADDLDAVLALLADDPISAARGDRARAEDRPAYERAFEAIDRDPAQRLLVVADAAGLVVGTMQLTLIPGLARRGATRLQVEAVRVSADRRSHGLGAAMMRWAVASAAEERAALVQLTSDAARNDAHRFYERLGFEASHVGFKLRVAAE
jgi:GNAT superfamily N-acetyltransferase